MKTAAKPGFTQGAPVVICLLLASRALACSVCGCGDPLGSAGDAPMAAGQWGLRVDAETLAAGARSDDDPGIREGLRQWTVQPALVWSPVEALSVLAQVPLIRKNWTATTEDGVRVDAVDQAGFGDMQVGARWFAWQEVDMAARTRRSLALTAGTTLPTGAGDARDDAGVRIDQHAQLGTGAFGPTAGLQFAWRGPAWGGAGTAAAVTHSTNRDRYRFGSAVRWSLRGEYGPGEGMLVTLGCDGRYADHDRAEGAVQVNTGGTVAAVTPAVWLKIAPGAWLNTALQLPVFTHLFGDQRVGPTVTAACEYTFGGS